MKIYCKREINKLIDERDNFINSEIEKCKWKNEGYVEAEFADSLNNKEILLFYMNKLLGQDLWIRVRNVHNDTYYFRFNMIKNNAVNISFVAVRPSNWYHNENAVIDEFSASIDDISKTWSVYSPVDLLTEEELREKYEDILQ